MSQPAKNYKHGYPHGEGHPKASLTDHEVELIRTLYEEYPVGDPRHRGYRWLARKFEVGKTTVRQICNYTTRNPRCS